MSGSARIGIGSWPLYPFLFAAHPVASLLLGNVAKVPLSEIVGPLLLIEGVVGVTLLIARAVTGSWLRAAMYCFLIVVLALYFQRFENGLKSVFGAEITDMIAIMSWLTLLALITGLIGRSKSDFRVATMALNAAAILFLIVPVSIIGYFNFQFLQNRDAAIAAINRPAPELAKPTSGKLPDIWYLVPDRYARGDVLQTVYGFDNSAFLDDLTRAGFQVLDQSAANYQRTGHSLASTLNLDYLDAVTAVTGNQSRDWVILYRLLADFKVWRALKPLGYAYSHFGSWWTPTAYNAQADHNINWKVVPTFQRFLWGHSLPGRIAGAAGWRAMDDRRIQCERIAYKFDKLRELAAQKTAPKFVFAHLLMPHPPFVLRADGSCLSLDQARARSRRDNYIDQVNYTNDQLRSLIAVIQAQSGGQAIIIVQADEGPWPQRFAGDELTLGLDTNPIAWADLSDAELREKMAILHAIYLPANDRPQLPATSTPVNTFRLIFRRWFGADLPALADQNHIYLDDQHVYDFRRVTERLRE